MARGETDYAADSGFSRRNEKSLPTIFDAVWWYIQFHGGKIVVEDEGGIVPRIARSAGALISRTEITMWVVAKASLFGLPLGLPLPRTLGTMR